MPSRIKASADKGLIRPPNFVSGGIQYEVITGSVAYGMATKQSDEDIYGFCIPPKRMVFPHLAGHIEGFGKRPQGFDQYQEHHIEDKEARKEYDFTIFSIIKFFNLTMGCNPNMIDTLFVPRRCIVHSTKIGDMVREQRDIFLSKKGWHTFKGYAYQQMNKMKNKKPIGKRKRMIEEFGYDVKFGSHVVRLLCEIEQILSEETLDLERNREQLKSIRRGEWALRDIEDYFTEKERLLESLYTSSKLPHKPRYDEIKQLLVNCLEEHYGSLSGCVEKPSQSKQLLIDLEDLLRKYR